MLVPPPLAPGARVRLVAPSSPFDRTLVWRGLGWLAAHFRVEFDWTVFERRGFLAGDDARRREELNRAFADPELGAIVAARGGYGASRIAHELDYAALRAHPKWIIGFSDVTALHVEAARVGLASLHAHNAAGLGRGDAPARAAWLSAVTRPEAPRRVRDLSCWRKGNAAGPLFGGNLTLLATCAAAGRLRPPAGAIWFLEDVTETSYRIDRLLTSLWIGGAFAEAAGFVLGEFTDCSAGLHGVPTDQVLRERLEPLGLPILAGLGAGHGRHNLPLHLGLPAQIRDGELWLGSS